MSEEVTQFLKDRAKEEDTFDNVMAMNKRPDEENSECDTDVEITLKASGLQKSKPVIRTLNKALQGTLSALNILVVQINFFNIYRRLYFQVSIFINSNTLSFIINTSESFILKHAKDNI